MRQKDIHDVMPNEKSHRLKKVWNHNDKSSYSKYAHEIHVMQKKIESLVGQPWDMVYSKIKSEFNDKCLKYMNVELNCYTENGNVYDSKGELLSNTFHRMYVDEHGILQKNSPYKWPKVRKPKKKIVMVDGQKFYKYGGIWYEVQTKPCTQHRIDLIWPMDIDIFYGQMTVYKAYSIYGESVYCTYKKQCGHRTCKKLNAIQP